MNVEKIVTDELREVGAAVRPPPAPDATILVRQAGRDHVRTRVRTGATVFLAAAVVLGAILLGNQLGKPSAAPSPGVLTDGPTPTGAPLRTWVDRNSKLHLDGVQVPGDNWAGPVTTDDLTVAEEGPYDTGETGIFLGSTLVGRIHQVLVHEIPVSPDRRTIAWVRFDNAQHTKASIVVARVSADGIHELGRLPLASLTLDGDNEGHERLLSVADDGTVLYGGVVGGHSWKPGGDPKPADISQFMYGPDGFPESAEDIRLGPAGTWGAWMTDIANPGAEGEEVLFTTLVMQRRDEPTTRIEFKFAGQYDYVNFLYWESDEDVIVYAGDKGTGAVGHYLRCDGAKRSCEYAPEPTD
jgi:hypothetical protein